MSEIKDNCKNYTEFEKIGTGSYGNIYKAQNKKTNKYVAIKEIDKTKYNTLTNEIFNEAEIMNIIKSENVLLLNHQLIHKIIFI